MRWTGMPLTVLLQCLALPLLAAENHVIPPGQEAVVQAMLALPLPDACVLKNVQISAAVIHAEIQCGEATANVDLTHPLDTPQAPFHTENFAVSATGNPPASLLPALAAHIKSHEADFHWQVIAEQPKRPPLRTEQPADMTASQWAAMQKGEALYVAQKMPEAYEVFVNLARETTATGVLGMVVATLAPAAASFDRVEELRKQADAAPDDPLKQFLAGVALHYFGHRGAQTREEKKQYYRAAIPYLEKAKKAFPKEARVYIYLAVSHFRLGEQKQAEEAIETAVQFGERDADAFYCHAEVFQRVDLPQAINDVKKYLALTEKVAKETPGFVSASKQRRVEEMLKHLEAFQAGTEKPEDLFDPLPEAVRHEAPSGNPLLTWLLPAGALVLIGVGAWLWRRKRGTPT